MALCSPQRVRLSGPIGTYAGLITYVISPAGLIHSQHKRPGCVAFRGGGPSGHPSSKAMASHSFDRQRRSPAKQRNTKQSIEAESSACENKATESQAKRSCRKQIQQSSLHLMSKAEAETQTTPKRNMPNATQSKVKHIQPRHRPVVVALCSPRRVRLSGPIGTYSGLISDVISPAGLIH